MHSFMQGGKTLKVHYGSGHPHCIQFFVTKMMDGLVRSPETNSDPSLTLITLECEVARGNQRS